MKLILNAILLFACSNLMANKTTLQGRVINLNSIHDTSFKIVFIKDKIRIDSITTGLAGFYSLKIEPGFYDLVFEKNRQYESIHLRQIQVINNSNPINFTLKFKYRQQKVIMSKDTISGKYASTHKSKSYSGADSEGTSYFESGEKDELLKSETTMERVGSNISYGAISISKTKSTTKTKLHAPHFDAPEEKTEPKPDKAGQVTAGHWRDLDHWEKWKQTNSKKDISQYMKTWGFFPKRLLKLQLLNKDGKACRFMRTELINQKGDKVWETTTDVNGNAYYWPNVYLDTLISESYKLRVKSNGISKEFPISEKVLQKPQTITLDFNVGKSKKMEIGFVVDATGSMGDEIKFLQRELIDVIGRVKNERPCLEIMTGSVFYRDKSDEYLTRIQPLSNNPVNTINFISNQNSGGGGDFPEAVDAGLSDAIYKLNWSSEDNLKIMFLLLDAPPHENPEVKTKIREYTQKAASMGIRIIPIAASGINKSTEFLMKYMAILTGGEYLYITDDSKIGNSHLKPTGGESKVEFLNDLMVELLMNYSDAECDEQNQQDNSPLQIDSTLTKEQKDSILQHNYPSEMIVGDNWYMRFFPNPARDQIFLRFSEDVEQIRITDLNGREILNKSQFGSDEMSVDVRDWGSGLYVVYAIRKGETISGKLIVMH